MLFEIMSSTIEMIDYKMRCNNQYIQVIQFLIYFLFFTT